jgi:hypothetical protein
MPTPAFPLHQSGTSQQRLLHVAPALSSRLTCTVILHCHPAPSSRPTTAPRLPLHPSIHQSRASSRPAIPATQPISQSIDGASTVCRASPSRHLPQPGPVIFHGQDAPQQTQRRGRLARAESSWSHRPPFAAGVNGGPCWTMRGGLVVLACILRPGDLAPRMDVALGRRVAVPDATVSLRRLGRWVEVDWFLRRSRGLGGGRERVDERWDGLDLGSRDERRRGFCARREHSMRSAGLPLRSYATTPLCASRARSDM